MVDNDSLVKLLKQIEDSNKRAIEEANKRQTLDIKEHINREVTQLKLEIEDKLKKKNDEYEAKYVDLKIKYEKLEKEVRKNNIIIFGLDNHNKELSNCVIDTLNRQLEINLTKDDIDDIYRVGKKTVNRPVKVKLITYLKKQEILRNCKKLKGSTISVAEDLSLQERKENQVLRQYLKRARDKQLNATIKYRKLFVNGQQYSAQELEAQREIEEMGLEYDEDLLEVKEKANSAPSTPTISKKEENIKENKLEFLEEVFEVGKTRETQERKKAIGSESMSKLRSSVRLNSSDKNKESAVAKNKK